MYPMESSFPIHFADPKKNKYGMLLGTSLGFVRRASPQQTVIRRNKRFRRCFQHGDSNFVNLKTENSLLAIMISKLIAHHPPHHFNFEA